MKNDTRGFIPSVLLVAKWLALGLLLSLGALLFASVPLRVVFMHFADPIYTYGMFVANVVAVFGAFFVAARLVFTQSDEGNLAPSPSSRYWKNSPGK